MVYCRRLPVMPKVKIKLPRLQNIALRAYDPNARRMHYLLLFFAFVLVGWLFYWLGSSGYRLPMMGENIEMAQVRASLASADDENRKLRREVARLARSTQIDVQAAEQIKQTLHEKELEILKLTEELVFYRSLLAPENASAGLEVRDFSVRSSPSNGEYYYDFLLTQSSRSKRVAKGSVSFSVDGKQKGVMRRLELKDIGIGKLEPIKYSFKYFQRLNGVFELPENFEPQQILIAVEPDGKSKQPLYLSYSWAELISGS